MSIIDRRNWNIDYRKYGEFKLRSNDWFALFDSAICVSLRLRIDELNDLLDIATDEDLSILFEEARSFSNARKMINTLNKYIKYD